MRSRELRAGELLPKERLPDNRSLLTEAEYAVLEQRYAMLQQEYAAAGGLELPLGHPRHRQHIAAIHELRAAGFDLPKPGTYIAAVFSTPARNALQAFARDIYYRAPRHYHCLLPLLGEVAPPKRPGHAGPGIWKRPELRS